MKTTALLFFTALFCSYIVKAQPPTYDDLLILFADENYDKLLKKAEKYTDKDDTKKDAIPYVFISRANFEISKNAELLEDYPKAWKDAVKYAGKAMRKDKDGSTFEEYRDYFSDLKKVLVEEMENYLIDSDYKKAERSVKYIIKIQEEDLGAQYMMAYLKTVNGDIGGAREYKLAAEKIMEQTSNVSEMRSEDLRLLKLGLMYYALHMKEKGRMDEAKQIINKGYQWFENEPAYAKAYDEIVN